MAVASCSSSYSPHLDSQAIELTTCILLLQDYMPAASASRHTVLAEKRQAYLDLVQAAFKGGTDQLDQAVGLPNFLFSRRPCTDSPPFACSCQMWHQITIDIPRTRPNVPLWAMKPAQRVSLNYCARPFRSGLTIWYTFAGARTDPLRLGDEASGFWLCAGYQRPCHSLLPSLPLGLHQYVHNLFHCSDIDRI